MRTGKLQRIFRISSVSLRDQQHSFSFGWSNNIRYERVPQEISIVAVKPGSPCCFLLNWLQVFSPTLCFVWTKSKGRPLIRAVSEHAHHRSALSSLYCCSPSASSWANQSTLWSGVATIFLFSSFEAFCASHLTVAKRLRRRFTVLTGHRQSSLGVHISY